MHADPTRGALRWALATTTDRLRKLRWSVGLVAVALAVVAGFFGLPQHPSIADRFLQAAITSAVGLGAVLLLAFISSLIAAPYQQRNVLRHAVREYVRREEERSRLPDLDLRPVVEEGSWWSYLIITNHGSTDTFSVVLEKPGFEPEYMKWGWQGGEEVERLLATGAHYRVCLSPRGWRIADGTFSVKVLSHTKEPLVHHFEGRLNRVSLLQLREVGTPWPTMSRGPIEKALNFLRQHQGDLDASLDFPSLQKAIQGLADRIRQVAGHDLWDCWTAVNRKIADESGPHNQAPPRPDAYLDGYRECVSHWIAVLNETLQSDEVGEE